MGTLPSRRPGSKSARPPKPARTVRLVFGPVQGNPGVFQITEVGVGTADYLFWPVPCDWHGFSYRVEKLGTDPSDGPYTVFLDAERGLEGQHSCECRGFLRWGRCRHVGALVALHQGGELK
jgi:hypothetical protein